MPAPDLEAFKVAAGELSSATKFNNALQAIEDEFSDIDPDQISGYPSDATKFLRGDGTWVRAAAARVFHNANQAVTSGTPLVLAFNSERYDNDSIHDLVTNNSRLTCNTAGKYRISANVEIAANATGARIVELLLNGSVVIARTAVAATAAVNQSLLVACDYDLVVGNYVEVRVTQDSGGSLNVLVQANWSPEFSMLRVA